MVKHTQTIRRHCFSMFDHFVGLALKGLKKNYAFIRGVKQKKGKTDDQQSPTYKTSAIELFCKNS